MQRRKQGGQLLSTPHAGWITFKLSGTKPYELSYLTNVPMIWLDAAIHGLETLEPFCVTGFLEPKRMVCLVSYWNCHVFVEEDDNYEMATGESCLEHSHTNMIDFCRMLHDDLSADIESYAAFMEWVKRDVAEEAKEIRSKLNKLQLLIESRLEHFGPNRAFY